MAVRLNVLSVPETVTGASRNCWLVAPLQASCTTAALSAVEPPDTAAHLPAVNVPIVYTSVVPATGVNVNDWLAPPWQVHWMRLTLSPVCAPNTSMHRLLFRATAVDVNVTGAACAGPACTTVVTT